MNPPDASQFFSKVEYLTIFATFIYGYVATQFLYGWAAMISYRRRLVVSREHIAWTVLTFLMLIDNWWDSWLKVNALPRHMLPYLLSLLTPLIFYLISVTQFPSLETRSNLDLAAYFPRVKRRNYLLFALLFVSFFLNDFFLESARPSDEYINTVALGLSLLGYWMAYGRMNYLILTIGFAALAFHMGTQDRLDPALFVLQNFSINEYLTTFLAFVYGAVASRYLAGWGMLIEYSPKKTLHVEYMLWTILFFLLVIVLWWTQWWREDLIVLSLWNFLLCLTTPTLCYFLSVIMFPVLQEERLPDTAKFFDTNKRAIFLMLGLILFTNSGISIWLGDLPIASFATGARLAAVGLAVVAVTNRNTLVRHLLLGFAYALLVVYVVME